MKNSAIKAACIGLLASPLFLISEPASAGLNGQQLSIDTGSGGGEVRVVGINDKGAPSTWASAKQVSGIVKTSNFYWQSTVTIRVVKYASIFHPRGKTKTCTANVPIYQPLSNWYSVSCI
jgi:hypothetical protein